MRKTREILVEAKNPGGRGQNLRKLAEKWPFEIAAGAE